MLWCTESRRVVDLRAMSVSPTHLVVHWARPTESNGLIKSYMIRHRLNRVGDCAALESPGRWSQLVNILSSERTYLIPDLRPYSQYEVKVWVKTAQGRGQQAVVSNTTASAGRALFLVLVIRRDVTAAHDKWVWYNDNGK